MRTEVARPRVVDLTQPLGPSTVMWPGSEPPSFTVVDSYADAGCFARIVRFHEHSGTHLDAPAHFLEGGETVDQIPPERLVCRLAMIDIEAQAAQSSDYTLSVADIEHDEAIHGEIPLASVVVVNTGWGKRISDAGAYLGDRGNQRLSFPGISSEAASWLIRWRQICGLGIDSPGIDPGKDREFAVHRRATLPNGVWHLEGLVNLDCLPARGATIFVGVVPFVGGSGAPARVIASL